MIIGTKSPPGQEKPHTQGEPSGSARYHLEKGNLELAHTLALKEAAEKPDSTSAHLLLAEVYGAKGETHRAKEEYQKVIDSIHRSSGQNNVAMLVDSNPEYAAAIAGIVRLSLGGKSPEGKEVSPKKMQSPAGRKCFPKKQSGKSSGRQIA
jgi:Flp pilus assembly protein TadD